MSGEAGVLLSVLPKGPGFRRSQSRQRIGPFLEKEYMVAVLPGFPLKEITFMGTNSRAWEASDLSCHFTGLLVPLEVQ
jgi:hypothetical protein